MFYVYVLRSTKDENLYVGSTNDLKRRFKEHNAGDVESTKPQRPLELLYYEAYTAEEDARTREKQLKLRGNALGQLRRRLHQSLQRDEK
jgi:putative endonuclease